MSLDKLINNLNISYYNNINKYLIKHNINNKTITEHLSSLSVKQNEFNNTTENDMVTSSVSTVVANQDDFIYKKPWIKLNVIHKIIKMKEFVNNLNLPNEKERIRIKNELIELIKNKTITKKNTVNYDESQGTIISLKHLEYIDGNYKYNDK